MKYVVNKEQLGMSPEQFMRRAGFAYHQDRRTGQDSFVRRLGQNFYPRFHVYLAHMGANVVIDLHLDQKKPSYAGSRAHSGEYSGELVEKEMERIKEKIIQNSKIQWEKNLPKKIKKKGIFKKLFS
jgi:hypothetical protein